MIIVLLIAASATSLVVGLTVGPFVLVWVGLGLSVVGLVLIGVEVRAERGGPRVATAGADGAGGEASDEVPRSDPDGSGSSEPEEAGSAGEDVELVELPAALIEPGTGGSRADRVEEAEPPASGVFAGEKTDTVVVVPGRRRYHHARCRLVSGREADEIGRDEAVEEGFTACTVCSPT